MKEFITGVFLAYNSWTDIRKREVSLASVLLLGGWRLAEVLRIDGAGERLISAGGLLAFFLAVSITTSGKLGMGDVWVIGVLSLSMRGEALTFSLVAAFLTAGLRGFLLLAAGRKSGQTQMPFIPCLFAGYLLSLICDV